VFYKTVLENCFKKRKTKLVETVLLLKTNKQKNIFENTFVKLNYQSRSLVLNFKKLKNCF
jgi:hypothetical protein